MKERKKAINFNLHWTKYIRVKYWQSRWFCSPMQNANWHPLSKCQRKKTNQNKNKEINHLKDYIAHYWLTSKWLSLQKQERRDSTGVKRSNHLLFQTHTCKHVSIHTCMYFPFVGKTCETSGAECKSQKSGQFTNPVFKRHNSTICGGAILLFYSISFLDDRTLCPI